VLLRDQDRSLWNLEQIAAGRTALDRALAPAAAASTCSRPRSPPSTSRSLRIWRQPAALCGELVHRTGSSVVELNQAAEAGDVEAALALADRLELEHFHYLHATRAELLRWLDRTDDARAAYERALELVHSDAERRFLEQRLAELEG
jgi:RNA polymerase sigma-70 factor (ECF subfamily)